MILTDKWLLQKISACVIHATTWSDHVPVTISINNTKKPTEFIPLACKQLYNTTPKLLTGNYSPTEQIL